MLSSSCSRRGRAREGGAEPQARLAAETGERQGGRGWAAAPTLCRGCRRAAPPTPHLAGAGAPEPAPQETALQVYQILPPSSPLCRRSSENRQPSGSNRTRCWCRERTSVIRGLRLSKMVAGGTALVTRGTHKDSPPLPAEQGTVVFAFPAPQFSSPAQLSGGGHRCYLPRTDSRRFAGHRSWTSLPQDDLCRAPSHLYQKRVGRTAPPHLSLWPSPGPGRDTPSSSPPAK